MGSIGNEKALQPTFGNGKMEGAPRKRKKADVAEHPKVFDHVGLLFDEPSS
jgi:hypothetical protein